MKLYLLILLMGSVYTGELEVEGDLSVTEGVTATSFVGDGSGLTNLPSLCSMKPDRIYRHSASRYETKSLVVPSGKFWIIKAMIGNAGEVRLSFNGVQDMRLSNAGSQSSTSDVIMLSDDMFDIYFNTDSIVNIYEYSISGSGNDQGMDYVEP